jgi:hypothetical protein
MVVGLPRLEPACQRGGFALPSAGKFKRIRVRCMPVAIACVVALCSSDLSIESCLVALSTKEGRVCPGGIPSLGPSRFASGGRSSDRAPAGP